MVAAARLYVIVARSAETAVVFRRGPTKQVQLWRWHRRRDEFEPGQWLAGRVYERRCDLSPDGSLLVYFAATYRQPYPTYTVVSRPPYFTALALFPKDDAWGGGGLFSGPRRLLLNHRAPAEMKLAPGFRLPKRLSVEPLGERSGGGEDSPIEDMRRERDGWRLVQEGGEHKHGRAAPLWIEYDPPRVHARHHPRSKDIRLEVRLAGIKEAAGPWYVHDHAVVAHGRQIEVYAHSDWADWDTNGDLLLARDGALWRASVDVRTGVVGALTQLIDLNAETFSRVPPPPEATKW